MHKEYELVHIGSKNKVGEVVFPLNGENEVTFWFLIIYFKISHLNVALCQFLNQMICHMPTLQKISNPVILGGK